jgi:hypothetical protein
LSSILEALKKAEQDAVADNGAQTPWPAPASTDTTGRNRQRRWWPALAIVVVAGALAAVFWFTRRPEPALPTHAGKEQTAVVAEQSKPAADPAERTATATRTLPVAAEGTAPPPVRSSQRPGKATHGPSSEAPLSTGQPPPAIHQKKSRETSDPKPEPVKTSPAAADSRPQQTSIPASTTSAEKTKTFRSDPRIELQALVWAPAAADRFVVINNHLIKEGGSVDNIVVVTINRDDVLLSEGSDRWHQEFKIR